MTDQSNGRITGFPPIIGKKSKILILGTLPGPKSLKVEKYYEDKRNHFWKILGCVFARKIWLLSYEEKCKFLHRKRIAVWDVLHSGRRVGGSDKNIKHETPNDMLSLFNKRRAIEAVGFNGEASLMFFSKYNRDLFDTFGERQIRYCLLPSSSGANAHMRRDDKIQVWKHFIKPDES